MFNFKRFFGKRVKSDRADSSLVASFIFIPMFLGVTITGIDVSLFFSNRGQIESIARDAARTVAIYGGNGDATNATVIEKKYGSNKNVMCSSTRPGLNGAKNKHIWDAIDGNTRANMTATECNILYAMALSDGLTSVGMENGSINCGPYQAGTIGTRTFCTIEYDYGSLPGAPLGYIHFRQSDGSMRGLFGHNTVTKSADSEVARPLMVKR